MEVKALELEDSLGGILVGGQQFDDLALILDDTPVRACECTLVGEQQLARHTAIKAREVLVGLEMFLLTDPVKLVLLFHREFLVPGLFDVQLILILQHLIFRQLGGGGVHELDAAHREGRAAKGRLHFDPGHCQNHAPTDYKPPVDTQVRVAGNLVD